MINSLRKKVTLVVLSLFVALATIGAAVFMTDNSVAIAEGTPTPTATYTVAYNYYNGTLNATSMLSKEPIENISIGSKIYIGYDVIKSDVTATQFGILSTTDPTASAADVWSKNGRLQFGSFNMYEAGSSYLVEITVNASNTFVNTVTKTASDSTQSTYSFTSVAGSGFSNTAANYFGIWASEGGIGNVILENVFICDADGNDLGVQFDGGRNQYYNVVKTADTNKIYTAVQGDDVTNTYLVTNKPYNGIGSKVIIEYTVDDITTNTLTQTGMFTTTAPTAGWPYTTSNGGNLWWRGNNYCLDKGYSYKFIFERLEKDIKVAAFRINVSTGEYENLYYPSSAAQTISGTSGYFGIWLGEGKIGGLKMSNIKAYDENGNSLGARFNTAKITCKSELPTVEYTGDSYTIVAKKDASQRICITSNTSKDAVDDIVFLKYYVAKSVGITINQTGFAITDDPTQEWTYKGGTMKFSSGCPILDEGYEYTIIFIRTSETSYDVTVTKDDLNGNVTEIDLSGYGLTNTLAEGSHGFYGLYFSEGTIPAGTTLENIRCYDQNGTDLGIVVNTVHMNAGNFEVTKNKSTVNYSVTDISGNEVVPSTSAKTYSTIVLPALTESSNCWSDGENFYLAGQNVRLTRDVEFKEVVKIATYFGAGLKCNETAEEGASEYGLRWAGGVNKFYLDSLVTKYGADNVHFLMIITTADILGDGEFTIEGLDGKAYQVLEATSWNAELEAEMDNGCYSFYASVRNIKEGNLNRVYVARTVLKYVDGENTYYEYGNYSLADQGRSVYNLAKRVYEDVNAGVAEKEFVTGIINGVLNVADNGEISVVVPNGYVSDFSVTKNGNVYTITGDKVNELKLIVINGKNYKFVITSGSTATVTLNK